MPGDGELAGGYRPPAMRRASSVSGAYGGYSAEGPEAAANLVPCCLPPVQQKGRDQARVDAEIAAAEAAEDDWRRECQLLAA
jgi:hypothetical protein